MTEGTEGDRGEVDLTLGTEEAVDRMGGALDIKLVYGDNLLVTFTHICIRVDDMSKNCL